MTPNPTKAASPPQTFSEDQHQWTSTIFPGPISRLQVTLQGCILAGCCGGIATVFLLQVASPGAHLGQNCSRSLPPFKARLGVTVRDKVASAPHPGQLLQDKMPPGTGTFGSPPPLLLLPSSTGAMEAAASFSGECQRFPESSPAGTARLAGGFSGMLPVVYRSSFP